MAVRNKNSRPGSGRPNQEPSTTRGKRRHTPEGAENRAKRERQSYGNQKRGGVGSPGVLHGPSHRAPGTSQEAWRNYMTGRSQDLVSTGMRVKREREKKE